MKQKTEIDIELTETVAYTLRGSASGRLCPQCESPLPTDEAFGATGSTEGEIYRLVKAVIENDGTAICQESLSDALRPRVR